MPDASRTRQLARTLALRRHAAVGLASGLAVALAAYAFRVGELAGTNPATRGSPTLFLLLAFVLAVTVGLLVTAALTARHALRLARTDAPATDGDRRP